MKHSVISVERVVCVVALCLAPLVVACGREAASDADANGTGENGPGANGTGEIDTGELIAHPLRERTFGSATRFRRVPASDSGLTFENRFEWGHPLERLYPHGWAGGGVAIGDVDGDGAPDLYLTSQTGPDRLYRQTAPLVFEDVTESAGLLLDSVWSAGASFGDIDGDGDQDLFVCNYDAPNRLYVNDGTGHFEERAAAAGLAYRGASVMGAFADHDGDGDLDLYLCTNRLYPPGAEDVPEMTTGADGTPAIAAGSASAFAMQDRPDGGRYLVKAGERDVLYRNDGRGHFEDVSDAAGIGGLHPGLSATWWDHDRDGRPDLYVCNDFWDADRLYHNQGDGTFVDIAADALPHTPWFSMGADFADVDLDGHMDLLAADMAATTHYRSKVMMGDMNESRWFLESAEPRQYMRNALYLGTGTGRFLEAASLAGVVSTDWTWSVLFGDLDADGRPDLYATNGTANHSFDPDLSARMRKAATDLQGAGVTDAAVFWRKQWELYREVPPIAERNAALRNLNLLEFEDAASAWGLDFESISFGAALCDLDRDGDLDIVVSNIGEPVALFAGVAAGHALVIELEGRQSSRDGLGATVVVESAGESQTSQLFTTHGYMSSGEPALHFGLGNATVAEAVSVYWPSGHTQRFAAVGADQHLLIVEPTGTPPVTEASLESSLQPALFAERGKAVGLGSAPAPERPFDDFKAQPLLPARLSRAGPALALGDADGDGDDDLWIGGTRGQPGQLLVNRRGLLRSSGRGPWLDDAGCEDGPALWLDVDGDGDQDLYVSSASIEYAQGSPFLRDRLYLNQGAGQFKRAPFDHLPDAGDSTGTVAAADFDGDGDLDLFVGARSISRRYPETPRSRLLVNEGGRFVDRTGDVAPGLDAVGLVTGCLWSDVDADGDADLLVTCEWGPVAYWQNEGGHLVDRTSAAGLGERLGWWNGIDGCDLDGDGDLDYAVTNAGWNTKYAASPDKPAVLLYGRFGESGPKRLLEVKPGEGGRLPVRGLSCSSGAMPFVLDATPTYHAFASSLLDEIYSTERLGQALELRATELASGVLWNEGVQDGVPRLRFEPLPRIAQVSAGYGVYCGDVTGDGRADVTLVHNTFSREPETGHWDGGLGLILQGDGGGGLQPFPLQQSGFVVPGDATALCAGDLDGDGRVELYVGRHGARALAFRRPLGAPGAQFTVRLEGAAGNPTAVGARVTFAQEGVPDQTAEVRAGGGHQSQSSAGLCFGRADESAVGTLTVRWPDGRTSAHEVATDARRITL